MQKFKSIFKKDKTIIGMIHVPALPGTPKSTLGPEEIIDIVLNELSVYVKAGIDAIAIENMHDIPYVKGEVGYEVSNLMAVIASNIKQKCKLPLGIQILAGANKQALAVAKASGADFIRAEGFVFGHLADEGYIDAQAGDLLRYRRNINADHIAVFTDIKKKHSSHTITKDVSLLDTARAAEFFLSDGIIITGNHTGIPASIEDLEILKNKLKTPVIVGSGITFENVLNYLPLCDAVIVGSYFKEKGYWENELSYERILRFMDKVKNGT